MTIEYTALTLENCKVAKMPQGLQYGDRVEWITKRDLLVRKIRGY